MIKKLKLRSITGILLINILLLFAACEKDAASDISTPQDQEEEEPKKETYKDLRDGQTYKTIRIGTQIWFAENLNYNTGNSWCYEETVANCDTYGRLYDWETAMNACPQGWRLPDDDDWSQLLNEFDMPRNEVGGVLKEKGTEHWKSPNSGWDESGFTALPGGNSYFNYADSIGFQNIGREALFWSSDEPRYVEGAPSDNYGNKLILYHDNNGVSLGYTIKSYGYSVRCLKNVEPAP